MQATLVARPLVAFSILAALAACNDSAGDVAGGSAGGNTGGQQQVSANACANADGDGSEPLFARYYCVLSFDSAAVDAARSLAEFAVQHFGWAWSNSPSDQYDSFAFRAVRAEFAHSVGLSGAGQMIAVVDRGFDLTHPDLADKSVVGYGNLAPGGLTSHGTTVAVAAAGSQDEQGVMGVAYNADLHLTSFDNGLGSIAAATADALNAGAIVQNNSWGYCQRITQQGECVPIDIATVADAGDQAAREQAFANSVGVSRATAVSYLDALRDFTEEGVVVFANSNQDYDSVIGVMPGLPLAFPELMQGWLTVVNAVPAFNGDQIVSAERLSAACLDMAPSCLTAEGVFTLDGSTVSVGTSFAAPIVSAGVAILAEAFPVLSGPEIRNRLLFTADNSFFVADDVTDFGSGLRHGYNWEFGHGFMNLEAALLPIGAIGIAAGETVGDGITPLKDSTLVAGNIQGAVITQALAEQPLMLLDSLGGNFQTAADLLVQERSGTDWTGAFFDLPGDGTDLQQALRAITGSAGSLGEARFVGGDIADVLTDLGLLTPSALGRTDTMTMAGLDPAAAAVGMQGRIGSGAQLAVHAHMNPDATAHSATGGGLALQLGGADQQVSFGFSTLRENGGALGMVSLNEGDPMLGQAQALDLGYTRALGDRFQLGASAQFGTLQASGSGIWGAQENTGFDAYGVSLQGSGLLADGDRLVLAAALPLAVTQGTLTAALPVTRDADGAVQQSLVEIDLAPAQRQIDLSVEYGLPLTERTEVQLGAAVLRNSGHVAGRTDYFAAAGLTFQW